MSIRPNLSPEKVIEIVQSIYQIEAITPQTKDKIKKTLILNEEQIQLQKLFNF
jgi:hypothetical protein